MEKPKCVDTAPTRTAEQEGRNRHTDVRSCWTKKMVGCRDGSGDRPVQV